MFEFAFAFAFVFEFAFAFAFLFTFAFVFAFAAVRVSVYLGFPWACCPSMAFRLTLGGSQCKISAGEHGAPPLPAISAPGSICHT